VLDRLGPDIVVFSASPHVVYDYIIYRLCKARGIPMFVYEWSYFGPHTFIMPGFEEGDVGLNESYRRKLQEPGERPARLSAAAVEYAANIRQNSDAAASLHAPKLDKTFTSTAFRRATAEKAVERRPPLRDQLRLKWEDLRYSYMWQRSLLELGWRARRGLAETPRWEGGFIVERGRTFEQSMKGHFVHLRNFRRVRRWAPQAHRRRREYAKLTKPVDLNCKYVILALHFQPERTTSPQGWIFVDQIKFVQMVAASIPPDWRVYVKEHLSQFNPETYGHLYRKPEFYRELARIPNVQLIAAEISAADLVDGSQAVATVCGSIGWEAVLRGRPALVCGSTWYTACEGIFRVQDRDSCARAIQQIVDGYKVDTRKVDLFIEALEETPIGVPQASFEAYTSLTEEENVARIADATERYMKSHFPELFGERRPEENSNIK
jgi:hypothetical protein